MESCLFASGIQVSGKLFSRSTVLISDIFNLFAGTFRQLTQLFETDNCIITYSDTGFKEDKGEKKLRHTTLGGYADELIAYLEKRQARNVTYIAHSVNALLAIIAATKAPHLFSRLVITSGFSSLQNEGERRYLCGQQAGDTESLFHCLMKQKDGAMQQATTGTIQLTDILRSIFATLNYSEAKSLLQLLLATDCRDLLGSLSLPVIILQVAADRIATNEAGYFMYRTIPDSQLIRIRAKGQLPQVDAPEEIVQAMKFFISSPA